jgi:hypothetical protein
VELVQKTVVIAPIFGISRTRRTMQSVGYMDEMVEVQDITAVADVDGGRTVQVAAPPSPQPSGPAGH